MKTSLKTIGAVLLPDLLIIYLVACSKSEDDGPAGITSGPDGNLSFIEANVNKIGQITTTGTFTEFTIP